MKLNDGTEILIKEDCLIAIKEGKIVVFANEDELVEIHEMLDDYHHYNVCPDCDTEF